MNWFYAEGGKQLGPISKEEFESLVQSGRIGPATLVWRDGMKDWQPFRTLSGESVDPSNPRVRCAECLKEVAQEEAIHYSELWVCASCKNTFFQKVREGQQVTGRFEYVGFWPRVGAKLIDGLIQGVAQLVVVGPFLFVAFRDAFSGGAPDLTFFQNYSGFLSPILWGIRIGYNVFFLGKYSATPGKMVLGMKVITSGGEPVNYLKGFLRTLAEILSGLICLIGYLMVAFDSEEHKALHDMICDTRVVRK